MTQYRKSSQYRLPTRVAPPRALTAARSALFVSVLFVGALTASGFAGHSKAEEAEDDAMQLYAAGDYATAAAIWQPAAVGGDAAAQFNVGLLFENGLGVEQDVVTAARWYRSAAVKGVSAAQYNLAALIVLDRPGEALFWLEVLASGSDAALAAQASQAAQLVAGRVSPDVANSARVRAADWVGEKSDLAYNGLQIILRESVPLVSLSDDQVKKMQRKLAELGYGVGPADGLIGKRSRKSLADWRRDNGLDPEVRRVPMDLISGN